MNSSIVGQMINPAPFVSRTEGWERCDAHVTLHAGAGEVRGSIDDNNRSKSTTSAVQVYPAAFRTWYS